MAKRMTMLAVAAAAAIATPLAAQETTRQQALHERVEETLRQAGPGTRFGLVVTTLDGRKLLAIAPDQRFIPASNTKIFTTAAAFDALAGIDSPDAAGGASVRLSGKRGRTPDVVLEGRGDARLSSAADCVINCLAALADAVATKARKVRDIIGDDSRFPDQRWSPGMSWNNIPTESGTAISALTLDDNVLPMRVTPAAPGALPTLELLPYYSIDNRAVTVTAGKTELNVDRLPGGRVLLLTGTILAGAEPKLIELGIDDPAHYAAWRFKALLQARGVRVTGAVTAMHRPLLPAGNRTPGAGAVPLGREADSPLARLTPGPVSEDIRIINKISQNVHSELLLRRLGSQHGSGSIEDGIKVVRAMLERAAVPRWTYDLSDGSGMSTYNRVAPRGMVILLRWIAAQPWGSAWRSTLPVAGIDGTLARRFRGTTLQGRLFAKTGTLNATNALSGYILANSGRTLIFSAYANDVPDGATATRAMDAALELIAREN